MSDARPHGAGGVCEDAWCSKAGEGGAGARAGGGGQATESEHALVGRAMVHLLHGSYGSAYADVDEEDHGAFSPSWMPACVVLMQVGRALVAYGCIHEWLEAAYTSSLRPHTLVAYGRIHE